MWEVSLRSILRSILVNSEVILRSIWVLNSVKRVPNSVKLVKTGTKPSQTAVQTCISINNCI